jgi:putative ATP-binding cassette transporter
MNLVYFLLRHSRGVVAWAVCAGVLAGVTNVGLLLLIHRALRPGHAGAALGWLFLGLCLVTLLSRVASQALLIRLSRRSVARLSLELSERILAAPLRQLEEMGPARLLALLTADVPAIAQGLQVVPTLGVNAVIVACCLAYLAWLSPAVLSSLLGLLVLGLLAQRLLGARALRALRRAREEGDSLFGQYRGLIEGLKELKTHRRRREAFLSGPLRDATEALERQNTRGQFLLALATGGGRFLFFGLIGYLLFVQPRLTPGLEPSTLAGYVVALLFLMAPLQSFGPALPALLRARVALHKVQELGKSLVGPGAGAAEGPGELGPAFATLGLVGVTHSYRRERDGTGFTLGPLHLALRPGEVVFVVGGNGSGKTTLVKLLVGLYRPERGEVRLDGVAVREPAREAYRQLFTAVFSDCHVFEGLLGLERPALDSEALDYLVELHLEHKVGVADGVLSTTELSRGQRKRLALLTAYLEDRPVYVFDEWASDQDPLFKDVFYTKILPRLKERGKLVVAVTHDDRYFPQADRLIHLEEGKVVSDAPPEKAPAPQDPAPQLDQSLPEGTSGQR